MIRQNRVRMGPIVAGFTLLLANVIILWADNFAVQSLAAFVLAGLLPGGLLVSLLLARDADVHLDEKLVLSVGLGYACILVGTLALHYRPGPLSRKHVLLTYDGLVACLVLLRFFRPGRRSICILPRITVSMSMCLLTAVALFFRFANLGYSEFQGDEVAVLHKAAESIQGRDDALFLHRKGPAEILVPMLGYAVSRRMSESVGRFPFALASLTGVLGLYVLGRRFLSHRAGWWAALLIALNGFSVAFGRIIQYQSLVFLFGVLGILCALRFAAAFKQRYLWLSAVFLAAGLLAHSDGVFATAAAGFVILRACWRQRMTLDRVMRLLIGPGILAVALLTAFYAPFALHPQFRSTREYFQLRVGNPPYNNLGDLFRMATAYNSVYYIALVAAGVTMFVVRRLGRPAPKRWLLPFLASSLLVLSWVFPGSWRVGELELVGLLYSALMLAVLFVGQGNTALDAALLWLGLPFLLFLFAFDDPRTHYYILFPGASLLVGAELDDLATYLRKGGWLLYGLCASLLAFSAAYLAVVFVSHTPEYQRTYPTYRIPFFWMPYGGTFPREGLFGFPYRAGWKTIGALYSTGELQGGYASNEESHITSWYTRDEPNCTNHPFYYILAKNVQDVQPVANDEIRSDYELIGRVWVGEQAKIQVYQRKPVRTEYRDYRPSNVASLFDRELTDPDCTARPMSYDPLANIKYPTHLRLGSAIEFLGHSTDRSDVRPGEVIMLTLYWRASSQIRESYTVFTHVEDLGIIWGQQDNIPGCGSRPTNEWEVGRVYADQYAIVLSPEIEPGPHPVVAGMYLFETGERLPVTDAEGTPLGNALSLGTINVVTSGG